MKSTPLLHIFLLFVFATFHSYAQDDFTKFDKDKQFNTVIVTQKMFDMMTNVKVAPNNEEEKAYFKLIKKLNSLKVYNTKNTASKTILKETVRTYTSKNGLKEHSRKSDKDAQIILLLDKDATENKVSELLMFNEGLITTKESIVLIIKGNFSLNELSALSNKMNLPIGDSMSKLSK